MFGPNLPESIILAQDHQFQVLIISMFDLHQVPNFIKVEAHCNLRPNLPKFLILGQDI